MWCKKHASTFFFIKMELLRAAHWRTGRFPMFAGKLELWTCFACKHTLIFIVQVPRLTGKALKSLPVTIQISLRSSPHFSRGICSIQECWELTYCPEEAGLGWNAKEGRFLLLGGTRGALWQCAEQVGGGLVPPSRGGQVSGWGWLSGSPVASDRGFCLLDPLWH